MTPPQYKVGATTVDDSVLPSWFLGAVEDALASDEDGNGSALVLLDLPAAHPSVDRAAPPAVKELALQAWPDVPAAPAVVWAGLVHPLAHAMPRESNAAFAIRVARMTLGVGTTVDHLAVVVMLWWSALVSRVVQARAARWLARPAAVAVPCLRAVEVVGSLVEWLLLLPGRSLQVAVTHVTLRTSGSRPVFRGAALSRPLQWVPLPGAGHAVMAKSAVMASLWLGGLAALVAYQAPGSWLALAPAFPSGLVEDEATLVVASSLVENSGPFRLGLWVPLSLLAVSSPAYSQVLAVREACRGGRWHLRALRLLLAPLQWLTFMVWPLARLFSYVGLGTIFGAGLVGVASGLAAAHIVIRALA